MTREQIESEKKELERQVQVNEDQIKTAQTAIYWLKKRIKVAEAQLKEMVDEQTPGEALQDISNGLEK